MRGHRLLLLPDLVTWTSHRHALPVDPTTEDLGPDRVIEGPKVLRNQAGTFVMFLHIETADYSYARLGWAVADRPQGPYIYLRSERPLGNISRDIGVFTDDDGTGYLLSEDREHGLHIYLRSEDYAVESIVATTLTPPSEHPAGPHGYESPAMVKVDDLYYLFGSELTGWATNDNQYVTAHSPAGPWSEWRDIAPPDTATYDSQISTVVPIQQCDRTAHAFIGDRWNQHDLHSSPPVWLPMRIGEGTAEVLWREEWTLNSLPAEP